MSHCSINCSSTFVRINMPLPLKLAYQHLSGSRLFAWLWQIPCNHHFLGGIIQTRDGMSWWGPQPFQLNNCKNRVRKLVSKRQVESVKEVCHWLYCHRTFSEWQEIEIARWNTDIARIVDPRRALNCQSCCYGIFAILHFVSGSHLTLQRNMSFRCLFVVMKSWDASFKGYFDKICLIKLQHAKFNPEHEKCFDCENDSMLENDMRWPNNFELIPPETEPHTM